MKPVLFLDIDGVLNSLDWGHRYKDLPRPSNWKALADVEREAESSFDPDAVARLNKVVRRTGCLVVLSSSWRKAYPLTQVNRMLRYQGFEFHLFAATPHLYQYGTAPTRGEEIAWWVEQARLDKKHFAIVDDDSDMEPHMDRLVQTRNEVGLVDGDVERLVEMLGEIPWG